MVMAWRRWSGKSGTATTAPRQRCHNGAETTARRQRRADNGAIKRRGNNGKATTAWRRWCDDEGAIKRRGDNGKATTARRQRRGDDGAATMARRQRRAATASDDGASATAAPIRYVYLTPNQCYFKAFSSRTPTIIADPYCEYDLPNIGVISQ